MTKLFLTTLLLFALCITGCSDSPSPKEPVPASSPSSTAGETPQPDGTPIQSDSDGTTSSQNPSTSPDESLSRKGQTKDPKYDARRTPQTQMTLDSSVKREFQNTASTSENEKYRKRAEARRAAKLRARESWKNSGVDAPLEGVRVQE